MKFAICLFVTLLAASQAARLPESIRNLLATWEDPVPFPQGVTQHQIVHSTTVTFDDVTCNSGYTVLARSGDVFGEDVVGQLYTINGTKVYNYDAEGKRNESSPLISSGQDFTSLLHVGEKIFMVNHMEAPYPGTTYLYELAQDEEGKLSVVSTENMDWSDHYGLWIPCAGSVSPWNTHLGSEEYSPDARDTDIGQDSLEEVSGSIITFMRYFDLYPAELTMENLREYYCPYRYGYPTEIEVFEDGSYTLAKHYTLSRVGNELTMVMPDNKTVYIPQDGSNGIMMMFVADTPGDLSSGELFGAKFNQPTEENAFEISWISMGVASNDDFAENLCMTFSDLFDATEPDENNTCPDSFTPVNIGGGVECLSVKEGMEILASRFEPKRYGGLVGATLELSKHEGITYCPVRNMLYTAMSEVRYGMEDNMRKGEPNDRYDVGNSNDIRVPYNPCGCVYSMEVDEQYRAINMVAELCGNTEQNTDEFNKCDINGLAAPDNLIKFDNGLLIGEDAGSQHQNDAVWYYDLDTKELTRIETTPYGSETTSPYFYPNINGYSYLMAVVQHPYGESDQDRINDPEATGTEGYIGVYGPCPALSMDSTYGGAAGISTS